LDDETGSQPYAGFIDRFREAYLAEMSAFLELLEGRIANPCPPSAALNALLVASAAQLSARQNRPILLDEVPVR
jgi:myo-inositol 2-dehydrogenase/D-chiro-inositol 1-dehydrogenase